MKKKINVKMLVIFGVLLVVIILGVVGISAVRTFMTGATSGVEPNNVTAVASADGTSATVSWTSNKASISSVEYGTTAASLVLTAAETDSTTDHRLSLTSLRPGTTYYYRIKVAEEVFDNGGIPYSFKTGGDIEPTIMPSIAPTEATTLPLADTNVGTSSATTCDSKVDYNKDGVVNSLDIITCRKSGGSVQGASTSVCDNAGDFNKDGTINSLDRIKCLQSQKL